MSKFTRCFRICAVLLLLGAVFPAPGLEIPPLSGKIVDQAQVLQEQAPAITAALEKLEAEKSCRTMIMTVGSLERMPIEALGAAVMDRWTGEKPEANRGLLLLIAVKDRRIRVEVGPGLADEWNDAAMERFLHAVQPGFREKKYGEAILAGLPVLAAAPEQAARKPAAPESSAQNRFPTGMIVIVAAVLAIFIYGAVRKKQIPAAKQENAEETPDTENDAEKEQDEDDDGDSEDDDEEKQDGAGRDSRGGGHGMTGSW